MKVMSNKPKLNLDGLNEQEREQVIEAYEEWQTQMAEDYLNSPVAEEITDEQAEAIREFLSRE